MRQVIAATAVFLAACTSAFPQAKSLGSGPQRMELTLERREGSVWRIVDPGLVFAQNDRVRFRFRTNFDGFLYVMNQSTSGKYEMLFPREDTGEQNRIEAGVEYVVPATQGWFRISGPPGHDVLYWMVTPLSLGSQPKYTPLPPPPKAGPAPLRMTPRCDETIWRARGACIDSSAGPKGIRGEEGLPENLKGVPGATSRELFFIREKSSSVVSSPEPLQGPVIYEFHLAHK
ncbi:MAG: DUF4384 domain-containing protein [Acidobacteriales bacterium]|nr:DUF4384 domain-containing protein [Terriglobales bacterium]